MFLLLNPTTHLTLQLTIESTHQCQSLVIVTLGLVKITKYSPFMNHQGGKLYDNKTISHVMWDTLMVLNGLNPSPTGTSLTLRESVAKSRCCSSKFFHTCSSIGCLNFLSFEHFSSCHLNEMVVFKHKQSLKFGN